MGTNYYWQGGEPCPTCGHNPVPCRHIGKSSAGWCFSLHVYPKECIRDLSDWQKLWHHAGHIYSEYGERVRPEDMDRIITERRRGEPQSLVEVASFCRLNNAELGPRDLYRSEIDGRHCIGHGDGTWDLIVGDFS